MQLTLPIKRRLIQALAAILLTSNFAGISLGNACVPILYCEACSLSWLGCPIGIMAATIAFHEIPWLILAIVVGAAVVVGRWFCGWICPTGFIQDLLFKIPSPKIKLPRWTRYIKYAVLAIPVIVIAYFFGRDDLMSFCKWCPTATASVVVPEAIRYRTVDIGWDLVRLLILAAVIVMAVLSHRSFCKVICPVGAMVSLGSRFSWLSIRMDANKCGRCKKCDKECPMDVKVEACKDSGKTISHNPECISCLTCEAVCTKQAVSNNSHILKR